MHLTAVHRAAPHRQLETWDKPYTILFNLDQITTEDVVHECLALLQVLKHLRGQGLNQPHRKLHSTLSSKFTAFRPIPGELQQRPIDGPADHSAPRSLRSLDQQIANGVQQDTGQATSPLHEGENSEQELLVGWAGQSSRDCVNDWLEDSPPLPDVWRLRHHASHSVRQQPEHPLRFVQPETLVHLSSQSGQFGGNVPLEYQHLTRWPRRHRPSARKKHIPSKKPSTTNLET
mmetsp:Transcript_117091/g.268796  ORF Transcript_117091/g.268796 Transcript_117091/m.268796 type:complete len:232 (-) Transcript_117091:274-969(-)